MNTEQQKIQLKQKHGRALNDWEWRDQKASVRKKIDTILEKISEKGIESLTAKEKKYLKQNQY